MKTNLRTGIAQINAVVGDFRGNADKIEAYIEKARAAACGLVVFPELCLTGYPPEDLLFKKHFVSENLKTLQRVSAMTRKACAVVGFVDRDKNGRIYNAAAVLNNGAVAAVYRKMCLPNYGVFDEKRYFSPGDKPLVLDTPVGRIAVSICEDIWPPDSAYLTAVKNVRPDLVINLSASPYNLGKQTARETMLRRRGRYLKAVIAYANTVGGQDELVFDGNSTFYDASGRRLACAKAFREDLLIHDLAFETGRKNGRGGTGGVRLRRLPLEQKGVRILPPVPPDPERRPLGPDEEVYEALRLGVGDYVRKNRFQKVVIGASGGIDSALVAALAVDAVGRENVVLVSMPSRFSSEGTRNDAKALAGNLGAAFLEIPIEPLRNAYLKGLEPHFLKHKPNEAEENLQARIRGNLLMALSNKFRYLVLTTGNKSELATGYCTLYGDMAGGFAVIKDVPKTRVYALCRWRNQKANFALIPESIISREPTAELRPNQKDTDTLPDYPTLDSILELYIEQDASADEIIAKGFAEETVKKVVRMVDMNEYKRRQGPVGVKITPKAFGRDRRMPITNAFL